MLQGLVYGLAAAEPLSAVIVICQMGKVRKPTTPGQVAVIVLMQAIVTVILFVAAHRL